MISKSLRFKENVKHLQLKHAWLLAQVLHALVALLIVKQQYKCSNYYVYIGATLFFFSIIVPLFYSVTSFSWYFCKSVLLRGIVLILNLNFRS